MFRIDATFKNTQIIAHSDKGHEYDMKITDNLTGEARRIKASPYVVNLILAFNLAPDGELETQEATNKAYAVLEPLFTDWPNNLRPIP